MDVTVLAVAGCPHASLLEERLAAALAGKIVPPEVIADGEEMPTRPLRKAKRRPVSDDLW